MAKNKKTLYTVLLRSLPFLFTLSLLFGLLLASMLPRASADFSTETEDALAEYTLSLSDHDITSNCSSVLISGSTSTITEAGSYTVTGSLSNGQIRVDTDKESKVRLILDGVSITNANSAAIYVISADKVVIMLKDGTSSSVTTSGNFVQTDDNNVDAVVFSKDDVTISGNGSLNVNSLKGHGIVSKDDLKIKSGTISVTAARKALSANDTLSVEAGTITLNAGTEGLEASHVLIDGGTVSVQAGDDGVNATWLTDSVTPVVEINGGQLTIVMGAGDTDAIDSNGNLIITGGNIDITGSSGFDYDGTATFTGGTITLNGQQIDSIPNQMMGGVGGMGRGGQQGAGGFGRDYADDGIGIQTPSGGFSGMQSGDEGFHGGGFGGMGHGRQNAGSWNQG